MQGLYIFVNLKPFFFGFFIQSSNKIKLNSILKIVYNYWSKNKLNYSIFVNDKWIYYNYTFQSS